jgi:hypothetical protein
MFISAVFAFPIILVVYLEFIQSPILAKREILLAAILWVILTAVVFILIDRVINRYLQVASIRTKTTWFGISAAVGAFLVLVTIQPEYFYATLPLHKLEINIPAGNIERTVTVQWLTNDLGDTAFSAFQLEGEWQRDERGLTHTGDDPASIDWSGRTGSFIKLVIVGTEDPLRYSIFLDGFPLKASQGTASDGSIVYSDSFARDWPGTLLIIISTWFTASFLFLVTTLILAHVQLQPRKEAVEKPGKYWVLFALPMLATWMAYLLTFFPAVMTPDSIRQWEQVISGHFNDALPVVHTLLVILLTRVWFSPAVVIAFQIIALALTVAWGIQLLAGQGLPRWACWGLALVFALSPVNGNMVVSLWKDIPYSICLLLLSLMILKAIFSKGAWLGERFSWLWLTLVGLGICLFRLNGLPVPILSLIVLAIVYRYQWKRVVLSVGMIAGMWLLIQGPIYTLLKVDRNAGFKQQVFIHHIAAHIATGGPLTPAESELASGILPLDQWSYDCCTNIPIWLQPAYSETRFAEKAADIQKLFIRLAFKEPDVEYRHLVCVSSLVWEVPNHCILHQEPTTSSVASWVETNDLGLKENSLLPELVLSLTKLKELASQKPWDVLFYTPAIFLYLGLYCTALMAFRAKQPRILLYFLPASVQSAVMLLINVSRDFRYQYGVYLVGLFSLGLLILSFTLPSDRVTRHGRHSITNKPGSDE